MTTDTTAATAKAATEKNKLALGQLRLLGVVNRPSENQALLRAPDGRTLMVQTGQDTPFGHIRAVGEDFVIVDSGLGGRRLKLPT